jgi:hypothetical protein
VAPETRAQSISMGLLSKTNSQEKRPMADLQKIVDDLSKLTVLEAADLAKRLEQKWEKERPTSSLSDEELKRARAELEARCAPNDFFEKVGVLAKKATPKEWFNEPRAQFLRDAMIFEHIEDAKRRHADSFEGIYVLWEGKLI